MVFAVLPLAAYAINTGPSSGDGVTVVEYYATHETDTLWQEALVGLAAICFIWFAETFAGQMSSWPAGIVVTVALYLVAIGCWEVLGEIYGGTNIVDVPSEGCSDAHMFYNVGVGAMHLANFAAAAFVAATAAARFALATPWRLLGWIGLRFSALG